MESNPFFEQDDMGQPEVPVTTTSPATQIPANPFDDQTNFQSSAFSAEDVFGKQEPEKIESKPALPPKPQQEAVKTSRIRLNELMANEDMSQSITVNDSIIDLNTLLSFDELWQSTLNNNASLLKSEQNKTLAALDMKAVKSRNYPYLRLNAGYGYTLNKYEVSATSRRDNLGLNFGMTLGFNLFDGNRRREIKNARIAIENAQLQQDDLRQALKADLSNLWQAYQNNIEMLKLERENLIAAVENHEIASERYMLGNLSGIEMREAQKSLLDAEERILSAEYDTKMCEISLLQLSGKITKYLE